MMFLPRLLPLAVALIAAIAPAQDETEAIRGFKAAFRKGNTAEALAHKRNALGNLRGLDSAEVAKALIVAYGQLDRAAEPLRGKRRGLLFKGGGSTSMWPLRVQLQPLRNLQEDILGALSKLRSKAAAQAILHALLASGRTQPFGLRAAMAERAADLPEESLSLVADAIAGSKSKGEIEVIVLLQVAGSLGRRANKSAAWATEQLQHKSEAVRRQAAKALATLCWPGSLKPLIERLDKERDATREQILDTLVILTAQGPGNTTTAWRAWLEKAGGPYVRGEVRLGEGTAEFRKRKPSRVFDTQGNYFGIRQDGNHILYVFDASLSMRAGSEGGGRGPTRGGGGRGGGGRGGGGRGEFNEKGSRWALCKKELHKALDQLTPKKTFNLVGFADHLQVFSKKMVRATPGNIARAHAWIDKVQLELQTNIHDALELGFYIAGRGTRDRYYPVVVDTIFFLSDGAPTQPTSADGRVNRGGGRGGPPGGGPGGGGRLQRDDANEILNAVQRWNPLGRIVIHSIGLGLNTGRGGGRRGGGRGGGGGFGGGAGARSFLERLAKQNDGRFVEPDK